MHSCTQVQHHVESNVIPVITALHERMMGLKINQRLINDTLLIQVLHMYSCTTDNGKKHWFKHTSNRVICTCQITSFVQPHPNNISFWISRCGDQLLKVTLYITLSCASLYLTFKHYHQEVILMSFSHHSMLKSLCLCTCTIIILHF